MSIEQGMRAQVVEYMKSLQNKIIAGLEALEPQARFERAAWDRPGGGGGLSGVISGGKVFEKGGVNFSAVEGDLPPTMMQKLGSTSSKFFATGVSLVIHPASPQVPTVHANFRYFEQPDRSWFGGGADLTPYTVHEENFQHFHRVWKKACDSFSPDAYDKYKKECDEYFFLPHRGETRGIGGIFFDYLQKNPQETFQFVRKCGDSFLDAYAPIVEKTKELSFTERQKKYQLLRRGRYVEFNLVYDRGTVFGLHTKGNTESILMSLPPVVHYDYKASLEETDEERRLMGWLKTPREWL